VSEYQRISCEAHSVYELAIMRGQSISVEIDGKVVGIKPTDIVTKRGIEFLIFISETGKQYERRADQVIIKKIMYHKLKKLIIRSNSTLK